MNSLPNRLNRWDAALALFLALLVVALSIRAVDEDRWSDWSFGDALTMLSLRQWEENGWLANRLLLLPQGYARPIHHLDDPDLRHLAHGISVGISPRVGPRLWYTHYPPGYLVPFALLAKLGLGTMAAWRLLALTISTAALLLMYLMVKRLASAPVAFLAIIAYALSPMFLGYADALANQPLDDLLRFGFMLAIVLSTRAATPRGRRVALLSAWGVEFLLSLCSYDSVFFLYLWLIGWDLLERRRLDWKKYLLFATGPLAAFGLCFLQNVWYLGWVDAARDTVDTFVRRSSSAQRSAGADIGHALHAALEEACSQPWLLLVVAGLYGSRRRFLDEPRMTGLPNPGALALLFLCGAAYQVVLPKNSWPYEGRQMAPFVAVLAAGFTVAVGSDVAALRRRAHAPPGGVRRGIAAMVLAAASLILVLFWGSWGLNLRAALARPSNFSLPPDYPGVLLAKDLRSLTTEHDAIFFDMDGFGFYLAPEPYYRMVSPILEYLVGSKPILAFAAAELVAPDLELLARRAPREFSPVLVSQNVDDLRAIVLDLEERGVLLRWPGAPRPARNAFVLDLTPVMNW